MVASSTPGIKHLMKVPLLPDITCTPPAGRATARGGGGLGDGGGGFGDGGGGVDDDGGAAHGIVVKMGCAL